VLWESTQPHLRQAPHFLILADCGGGNSAVPAPGSFTSRKRALRSLPDRPLPSAIFSWLIQVESHRTPSSSQRFSKNWAGRPLDSYETATHTSATNRHLFGIARPRQAHRNTIIRRRTHHRCEFRSTAPQPSRHSSQVEHTLTRPKMRNIFERALR